MKVSPPHSRGVPLISLTTYLGGGGGGSQPGAPNQPPAPSGHVPYSTGSNAVAWGSNVAIITSNGSNMLQGPYVNFASGTGINFAVASNSLTISSTVTGGGSGSSIYLNVTDAPYSAAGDGTTNDTAAIQAAIDALEPTGGTIFFPAGDYKITTELVVDPASFSHSIRFLGEGATGDDPGVSRITQATSNTNAIRNASDSYDLAIEHMHIVGPTGNSSGSGLYAANHNISTVNVQVTGFYYGLRIGTTSYYSKHYGSQFYDADAAAVRAENLANNASFINCHVGGSPYGYDLLGGESHKVMGGSVEQCTTAGIRANGGTNAEGLYVAGVYFEQGDGIYDILIGDVTEVRGTTLVGNLHVKSAYSGTGFQVKASYATGLTIIGGEFHSTSAIEVDGSSSNVVVVNPTLRNAGTVTLPSGSIYIKPGGTIVPSAIGTAAHGTSQEVAVADHVHAIGGAAGGDLSGTYPNPSVSDDSHSHTSATAPGGGEILITDTPAGTPLIFADLLQNEAQDDLLYEG